jgi:hypothetical protein
MAIATPRDDDAGAVTAAKTVYEIALVQWSASRKEHTYDGQDNSLDVGPNEKVRSPEMVEGGVPSILVG